MIIIFHYENIEKNIYFHLYERNVIFIQILIIKTLPGESLCLNQNKFPNKMICIFSIDVKHQSMSC
jgi:hypothetical protein